VNRASHRPVSPGGSDVTQRDRCFVQLAAPEEHGRPVWLDLPKDDSQAVSANDDLAPTRVHDAKRAHSLRKLLLVTGVWTLWQRPRHVRERNTQRVRRPGSRERWRDGSL
jgi:hypothetical protein